MIIMKLKGGNSGGNSHLTGGIENPFGNDSIIIEGKGKKTLRTPKIEDYRIMKAPGLKTYRIVFKLSESAEIVHLQLQSIGEDGTKEILNIDEYRFGKKREKQTGDSILLRNINGGESNELFIYLKNDEKMCLSLHVY